MIVDLELVFVSCNPMIDLLDSQGERKLFYDSCSGKFISPGAHFFGSWLSLVCGHNLLLRERTMK